VLAPPPGSDFDDEIVGADIRETCDPANRVRIGDEVLTERAPW
jgi:hypothetical protein